MLSLCVFTNASIQLCFVCFLCRWARIWEKQVWCGPLFDPAKTWVPHFGITYDKKKNRHEYLQNRYVTLGYFTIGHSGVLSPGPTNCSKLTETRALQLLCVLPCTHWLPVNHVFRIFLFKWSWFAGTLFYPFLLGCITISVANCASADPWLTLPEAHELRARTGITLGPAIAIPVRLSVCISMHEYNLNLNKMLLMNSKGYTKLTKRGLPAICLAQTLVLFLLMSLILCSDGN